MTLTNQAGEALDFTDQPATRDDVLVIIGHGVTANKDRPHLVTMANELARRGIPSVRFSFAGNGDSEGKFEDCTISKEVEDLTAVLDQLQSGDRKLAYVGHSMGGAVGAITAARDERIKAMVSLAGMVDTERFYEDEFGDETPGNGFMWDDENHPLSTDFRDDMMRIGSTLDAVKEVRCPWIFIHGDADDVVFPEDSEDAHAAAKCEKELVILDGYTHSFSESPEVMAKHAADFLEKHL